MSTSPFSTTQYSAEHFVESAGAIAFKRSTGEICLLKAKKGHILLAKGRRNVGESRQAAALREAKEETGFTCHLLPVTMMTRSPPAIEVKKYADVPRLHQDVCEPFMVTHRLLGENNIKIVWWYIATIDEDELPEKGELSFSVQFYSFDEAVDALTFETDREVVKRAIEIFNVNCSREH